MEHCFKGKTVLVTGAGWGIGAATALLYAAYGAKVIVSDTSRKGGKDTLAKIKNKKGNATYIRTDVNNAAACWELIKRTISTYGSIDIACNNSAILSGLNNCMQFEIEAMQKQGGGIIVNISSIVSAVGLGPSTQYTEAKYGAVAPLQEIPGEYPGIRIHTIAPSFVRGIKSFPMKRQGTIQEVAGLVLWLSSDETRIFPNRRSRS
jgi:NAD(P)-dependent dehydrogenase (short-subunit alcohol dehydrogenase family)